MFRVTRVSDGKVILQHPTTGEYGVRWGVFIDGFVANLDSYNPSSKTTIFDMNGTQTAEFADGWSPVQQDNVSDRPAETSVPVAEQWSEDEFVVSGISPRTGNVLWTNKRASKGNASGVRADGLGTFVRITYTSSDESGPSPTFVDAYTGDVNGAPAGSSTYGEPIGTDGSRVVAENTSFSTTAGAFETKVYSSATDNLWTLNTAGPVIAFGGGLYVADQRLL